MKPATEEWVDVAEVDVRMAWRAMEPPDPIYEGVGFHAQQAIGKYLKAVLEEAARPVPRTHDLGLLLARTADLVPGLAPHRADIEAIVPYAVTMRYPHDMIELADLVEEAEQALTSLETARQIIRSTLGFPTEHAP